MSHAMEGKQMIEHTFPEAQQIVAYSVVAEQGLSDLEESVKAYLTDGWQLYGPLVHAPESATASWLWGQPMVRYAEPEPGGAFVSRAEFVNLQSWQKMLTEMVNEHQSSIRTLELNQPEPAHDDELAKLAFELATQNYEGRHHYGISPSMSKNASAILAIKAKREGGEG